MDLEIIKYRRDRASESIKEAELLLKNKKLHAAVNRIYYAVFYEVVGLLFNQGSFFLKTHWSKKHF